EPGEHDHGGERENPPRLHDDDGEERECRIAEPVQPAVEQAGRFERPVDHAERGVEDPRPGDRRERDRHRPWQEEDEAGEPPPPEGSAEDLSGGRREDDHEHLRADRDHGAVAERPQEDRIAEDRGVIAEPRYSTRRTANRNVRTSWPAAATPLGRKCSGRNPSRVRGGSDGSLTSSRFIGGWPTNVATNVSTGSS